MRALGAAIDFVDFFEHHHKHRHAAHTDQYSPDNGDND
jgi:hypothetical protein